jgi:hypothetical protein
MDTTRYGDRYTATIVSEDASQVRLQLTPRAGQSTPYTKIVVTVGKDHWLPSDLQYYDASGHNTKSETRTGYTCVGDVCTWAEAKMVDSATGGWTRIVARSRQVNVDISDAVFTARSLS